MIKPLPIAAIPAKDLLQPDEYPRVDHLVTEDDAPVDNLLAEKQARLLMEALRHAGPALKKGQEFQAMMNVGLFYSIRAPGLVPDFLYSVDVELLPDGWREKEGRSCFPRILGKMPDLVLEIVANHESGEEARKLQAYARLRIPYYVIYDPLERFGPRKLRIYKLN